MKVKLQKEIREGFPSSQAHGQFDFNTFDHDLSLSKDVEDGEKQEKLSEISISLQFRSTLIHLSQTRLKCVFLNHA